MKRLQMKTSNKKQAGPLQDRIKQNAPVMPDIKLIDDALAKHKILDVQLKDGEIYEFAKAGDQYEVKLFVNSQMPTPKTTKALTPEQLQSVLHQILPNDASKPMDRLVNEGFVQVKASLKIASKILSDLDKG